MPEYHLGTRVEKSSDWGQYGTIIEEPFWGRERGKALVMWDRDRKNPVRVKKYFLNTVTQKQEENMNRFKIGDRVLSKDKRFKGVVTGRPNSSMVEVVWGSNPHQTYHDVKDVSLDLSGVTTAVPGSSHNPDLYDTPVDRLVGDLQKRVTKLEEKARSSTIPMRTSPGNIVVELTPAERKMLAGAAPRLTTPKSDTVVRPKHYDLPGGIQVIDVIAGETFERGSILKYIFRAPKKGTELEDLKKAANLLAGEIARVEKREKDAREAVVREYKRSADAFDAQMRDLGHINVGRYFR